MIRCNVVPSARLEAQAYDPKYITTEDDLPKGEIELPAVPRAGDGLEMPDGSEFTVVRAGFVAGDAVVWLTVE